MEEDDRRKYLAGLEECRQMNGFVGREGENAVLETEDAQHSNELIRDVVAEAIF